MATLANGLMTIESASILWRDIINYSCLQLASISVIDDDLALYSDTTHTHSEYKTRASADTEVTALINGGLSFDVEFILNSVGVILKDRTLSTYSRLYVDNGVLLIEGV